MAWDKRGYYYRKRREGKHVISEYIGKGELAEGMAYLDALDREWVAQERAQEQAERAYLDELESQVKVVYAVTDTLMRATLQAAGYHQHDRGQWRKRHATP